MKKKVIVISLFIANLNYILYNSVGLSDAVKALFRLLPITILLFLVIINSNKYTVNKIEIIWIYLLGVSLLGFSINSNLLNFVYIVLVLFAVKDIDTYELINSGYQIMIISIVIIVILLQFDIIHNFQYSVGGRTRNTFGFGNVNAFSALYYSFVMMFLLSREKMRLSHYLLAIVLSYLTYEYTDSKTFAISLLIYLVSAIFLVIVTNGKISSRYNIFLKALITSILILPAIFSFMSPLILEKCGFLDTLASGRISIFSNYIQGNNFQNIVFGGTNLADKDNTYLLLLFSTGIWFTLFIFGIILRAAYQMIEKKAVKHLAFLISFIYYGAFEALLIRPELVISIVFWILIYKENIGTKSYVIDRKAGYRLSEYRYPDLS